MKTKQKSARQEVQEAKIKAAMPKIKLAVYKFTAAVALVVAAYSSYYKLIQDHTTDTPNFVAQGLAAIITIALVFVLAQCSDNK